MNASTAQRPATSLEISLAGLQAGMIAICWMLAWMGLSAMGQRRSFWTAENLIATLLHGDSAIRRGFGVTTWSGLALYLLCYSLLGAVFAFVIRSRFTSLGTVLLGVLCSVGWYALVFRALGQSLMPLVWLLHAEKSTAFGHVIFGILVARFPAYLPAANQPVATPPADNAPVDSHPAETIPPDTGVS